MVNVEREIEDIRLRWLSRELSIEGAIREGVKVGRRFQVDEIVASVASYHRGKTEVEPTPTSKEAQKMDTLNWRVWWGLWTVAIACAVAAFVLALFAGEAEASGCRTVTIQQGIRIIQCIVCTNADGEIISIQCI